MSAIFKMIRKKIMGVEGQSYSVRNFQENWDRTVKYKCYSALVILLSR